MQTTLTLLLICSSLSGENGHPLQIYLLLSSAQIRGEDFRYPNGQHLPTTGSQEPSLGTAKAYMFSPHFTRIWEASNFKRFNFSIFFMVRGANGSQTLLYHNSTNAPFLDIQALWTFWRNFLYNVWPNSPLLFVQQPPRGGRPVKPEKSNPLDEVDS